MAPNKCKHRITGRLRIHEFQELLGRLVVLPALISHGRCARLHPTASGERLNVQALARQAKMSRTACAIQFAKLVGEPPTALRYELAYEYSSCLVSREQCHDPPDCRARRIQYRGGLQSGLQAIPRSSACSVSPERLIDDSNQDMKP